MPEDRGIHPTLYDLFEIGFLDAVGPDVIEFHTSDFRLKPWQKFLRVFGFEITDVRVKPSNFEGLIYVRIRFKEADK